MKLFLYRTSIEIRFRARSLEFTVEYNYDNLCFPSLNLFLVTNFQLQFFYLRTSRVSDAMHMARSFTVWMFDFISKALNICIGGEKIGNFESGLNFEVLIWIFFGFFLFFFFCYALFGVFWWPLLVDKAGRTWLMSFSIIWLVPNFNPGFDALDFYHLSKYETQIRHFENFFFVFVHTMYN